MGETFQIQTATWRDLNTLREIENVCFGEDAWPLWDLVAALTLPGIVRLKALSNGRMVGFISGDSRPAERLGWITTLGVLPAYRRQGIAAALLKDCEEKISLPRIRLCVRRNNDGAIQLYHKFGYTQVGVWPNYYQDREDALVLEKVFKKEEYSRDRFLA
ncbi:MAG: GNAT family N-acetyltransferase [Chloroflexi bacterium]|nr:GNAT family N-acetyltransferase [Chloroflexota bacterium]